MENQPDQGRLKADEILIHPEPRPCSECQQPTHFAVFRPWAVRALCPVHLLHRLSPRSYARLHAHLWDVVYQHTGNSLFEPQRAYWETLPDEEKWEKVGRSIHEQAVRRADEAVSAMRFPEAPARSHSADHPQRQKRNSPSGAPAKRKSER